MAAKTPAFTRAERQFGKCTLEGARDPESAFSRGLWNADFTWITSPEATAQVRQVERVSE
jgi:hypothetical protein